MKKVIAILLCSMYIFSGTELDELLRLGSFVAHYFEHKEADKDLSIADFIELHYNGDKHDADHDKDMQLPFKQHHCSLHANMLVTSPQLHPLHLQHPVPAPAAHSPVFDSKAIPSSYLSKIWQPPKYC